MTMQVSDLHFSLVYESALLRVEHASCRGPGASSFASFLVSVHRPQHQYVIYASPLSSTLLLSDSVVGAVFQKKVGVGFVPPSMQQALICREESNKERLARTDRKYWVSSRG